MHHHWFTWLTLSFGLGACASAGSSVLAPTTTAHNLPERAPLGPRVSAGAKSTCFLRQARRGICLGEPTASVEPETAAEAIAQGGPQLAILFANGNVKIWNYSNPDDRRSLTLGIGASQISLGRNHGCALSSGQVKCWGSNDQGQLGLEDRVPRYSEDAIASAKIDGTVTEIAAGDAHTCALLEGGDVKCWGNNDAGQLGIQSDSSRGTEPGEMGANLPKVALVEPAVAVAAGAKHSCALLESKRLQCWGSNLHGALGGNVNIIDVVPAIVDVGDARIKLVRAAASRTCVVLDNNAVKCWGRGDFGALGVGHSRTIGLSPSEMGHALQAVPLAATAPIVELAMGESHNCVLFANDRIKCWGNNQSGQLGTIDRDNRGDRPGQMGERLPFADFGK